MLSVAGSLLGVAGALMPSSPILERLEAKVNVRTLGHFDLSADGTRAAYSLGGFYFGFPVVPRFGEDNNVHVVDLSSGVDRVVTSGPAPKTAPRFSPDGTEVVYEVEGDLWVATIATLRVRRVTRDTGRDFEATWSPTGAEIAFVSNRGGHTDVWVASARGEEHGLRRVTDDAAHEEDPQWAPDGATIAYTARGPREHYYSSGLFRAGVRGGAPKRLTAADDVDNGALRHSPDGKKIAYVSDRSGFARLVIADPDGANPTTVATPAGDCRSPYWRVSPRFSPDGDRLLVSLNREGRLDLVDVEVRAAQARLVAQGDGLHHALGYRADGAMVYVHETPRSPPTLVVREPAGPRAIVPREALASTDHGTVTRRRVTFESADGVEVHATLVAPLVESAPARLPAVINLHPNSYGQFFESWNPFVDVLAGSGYVVLNVDQRGSAGYGRAYRDAAVGEWGLGTYDDVRAAAQWLKGQDVVEPSRIGVMGLSFGGYLALLGLVRDPDLFAAGIDLMGVTDRRGRFAGRNTLFHVGKTESEAPALYARISPVTQMDRLKAPLLILHAEEDRNVSVDQTRELVVELDRLGKKYDLHIYPGEAHGLADPRNQLDSYRRILAFLDRHLKDPGSKREEPPS